MLYGSQQNCTEMLPCDRSHQLGKGQQGFSEMSKRPHPSRLVRERPQIRHRNDTVCTPFPISFMEVNNSQQRCHPDTASKGRGQDTFAEMSCNKRPSRLVLKSQRLSAEMPRVNRSQGKGRHAPAEMPFMVHPFQPVYRGHHSNATMLVKCRLSREGSERRRSDAKREAPFPTSLWANPGTQKCHGVDAHQFWANRATQKCQKHAAQYNQRPPIYRRDALYQTPRN